MSIYQFFICESLILYIQQQAIINKMETDNLLDHFACPKQGLNYLIPLSWWQELILININIDNVQNMSIPPLNLSIYLDSFLLDFQQNIIEELEHKCNYIIFNTVRLNHQVNRKFQWKAVSADFWKHINKKIKEKCPVLTFINQDLKSHHKDLKQIQIVYCSKNRSDAFIGYIPAQANLINLVRQVGYDMGYIEMQRSKVTFIDRFPQKCFTFQQISHYTLANAPDLIVMAFNMQRIQDQQQIVLVHMLADNNTTINESNEVVVGDLHTMIDDSHQNDLNQRINDRTLSTGAGTPFSLMLSDGFDLDRQYRVNGLFGAKEPEQIQQMKIHANNIIHKQKQLILTASGKEQNFAIFLQKMVEDLVQQLTKKKNYKEKELLLNYQ